jgi:hypothetical protein
MSCSAGKRENAHEDEPMIEIPPPPANGKVSVEQDDGIARITIQTSPTGAVGQAHRTTQGCSGVMFLVALLVFGYVIIHLVVFVDIPWFTKLPFAIYLGGMASAGFPMFLKLRRIMAGPRPAVLELSEDRFDYDPGTPMEVLKGVVPSDQKASLLPSREESIRLARKNRALTDGYSTEKFSLTRSQATGIKLDRLDSRQRLTIEAGAHSVEIAPQLTEPEREWLHNILIEWRGEITPSDNPDDELIPPGGSEIQVEKTIKQLRLSVNAFTKDAMQRLGGFVGMCFIAAFLLVLPLAMYFLILHAEPDMPYWGDLIMVCAALGWAALATWLLISIAKILSWGFGWLPPGPPKLWELTLSSDQLKYFTTAIPSSKKRERYEQMYESQQDMDLGNYSLPREHVLERSDIVAIQFRHPLMPSKKVDQKKLEKSKGNDGLALYVLTKEKRVEVGEPLTTPHKEWLCRILQQWLEEGTLTVSAE